MALKHPRFDSQTGIVVGLIQRDIRTKLTWVFLQKVTKGGEKQRRCMRIDAIGFAKGAGILQLMRSLVLIACYDDSALRSETLRSRHLVIVAGFVKTCATWHHDNLFTQFESRDNRAHAGVSDD